MGPEPFPVPLTKEEYERVERLAKKHGTTVDEMADALFSGELEKRVKRKTGKHPAKVYKFRKKPTRAK